MQARVDVEGFLERLAVDARLLCALRSGQIDQVELGDGLDVATELLGLNLNDKDTVAAGRRVVLRRLTDDTVGVADEQ